MDKEKLIPLVVVLGPTASGKTSLSIKLAKKFNGEIINADSRQIYREMNIGTAKIPGKMIRGKYVALGVVHHLIDIKNPSQKFSVQLYKNLAVKSARDIFKRGKLPFLVGGTGLYIKAVVDNLNIPKIKADWQLREKLEKKSLEVLAKILIKKDPDVLRFIDLKNKRRIIRALEVMSGSNKKFSELRTIGEPIFSVLELGIEAEKNTLKKNISSRLKQQLNTGLEKEVEKLYKKYNFKAPGLQAIGYQEFIKYFQHHFTKDEALGLIGQNTLNYAKRQMTWFKKDKRIKWVHSEKQVERLIKIFINKNPR
ncbi:MAG: tRNA (adenosine(37)-N6)-dimethylallyltransferase MiaA [Patescibacteria group bacterium]